MQRATRLHRAPYCARDRGLVTFDTDYRTNPNEPMEGNLAEVGLNGGLAEIRAPLFPMMEVRQSRTDRPSTEIVTRANASRGWAPYRIEIFVGDAQSA